LIAGLVGFLLLLLLLLLGRDWLRIGVSVALRLAVRCRRRWDLLPQ
jgi:hypothetical protein